LFSVQFLPFYIYKIFCGGCRSCGPAPALQPQSPDTVFITKLTKTPGGLLPIPNISKRRKKTLPPSSEAPRRSRRLPGLGVKSPEVCSAHLKKQVMRALDLEAREEREQLDQQTLEDYAHCFRHPLSHSHTRALAALFCWTPPVDDYAAEVVECLG